MTHSGVGTAILVDKTTKIQPARQNYNYEKMASCLIKTSTHEQYDATTFVGILHSNNENTKKKWEQL